MPSAPAENSTDELDLAQFWRDLTWSKTALVACLLAGLSIGVLIGVLVTPTYRTEVLIAPIAQDASASALGGALDRFSGLAALAGINLGGQADDRQIFLATLRSRQLTLEFIEDNNLLPELFADRWDSEQKRWRVPAEDIPTQQDAWEKFDRRVRKLSEKDDGLFGLSIDWRDPAQAEAWANGLVTQANELLRSRAISEAQKSIDFLNAEAEKTTVVGLQQAIYRLVEGQINKIMLANARREYAFKVIDPAVRPDDDRYRWPNFVVLIGVGGLLGAFAGCLISMFLARRAAQAN